VQAWGGQLNPKGSRWYGMAYAIKNPRRVTWNLWPSALNIPSEIIRVTSGTPPAYTKFQPTDTRSTIACGYCRFMLLIKNIRWNGVTKKTICVLPLPLACPDFRVDSLNVSGGGWYQKICSHQEDKSNIVRRIGFLIGRRSAIDQHATTIVQRHTSQNLTTAPIQPV